MTVSAAGGLWVQFYCSYSLLVLWREFSWKQYRFFPSGEHQEFRSVTAPGNNSQVRWYDFESSGISKRLWKPLVRDVDGCGGCEISCSASTQVSLTKSTCSSQAYHHALAPDALSIWCSGLGLSPLSMTYRKLWYMIASCKSCPLWRLNDLILI